MRGFTKTLSIRFSAVAVLGLCVVMLPLTIGCQEKSSNPERKVKPPNVAGTFYPSEKDELKAAVEKYIDDAKVEKLEKVRALIVPHAGYIYSGSTAGYAYAAVKGAGVDTVFVIGPSHSAMFDGISIPECDAVKTPLGEIPISPVAKELRKADLFITHDKAHEKEHSVEVQYPFLQVALKDFSVVPIVSGFVDTAEAASEIMKYADKKSLIIASSDLSHYFDYDTAKKLDSATVRMIIEMRTGLLELPNFRACGKNPILILLEIAKAKGWKPKLLDMRNSGDTAGEKTGVVGYAAIVFVEGDEEEIAKTVEKDLELSRGDGEYLVGLARKSLEHYLKTKKILDMDEKDVPASCREMKGCFVTLTKKGQLRGCIGIIVPENSLYQNVIQNAVDSAVNDARFKPVTKNEFGELHFEVSVLTLPKKLDYSDSKELLEKLRPGVDGVILTFLDQLQSTYLPQVWEQIPDKVMFLNMLTKKASPRLPQDAWKTKYAKVFVYQAQIFEEEKEKEEEGNKKERAEDEN